MATLSVTTIASLGIGLIILFLLAGSLIMPFFATTYEHGTGTNPCNRDNTCSGTSTNINNQYCTAGTQDAGAGTQACTNCNGSAGYETFIKNCLSLIDQGTYMNNSFCNPCTTLAGYRTSYQGLLALILVIALIGFAVTFIKLR